MVEEIKKIKQDLIGYLKAHDLSDGQDQAWHETLDISDIMFKRVNLWEAVFMHQITTLIKVNLFNTFAKSEKRKTIYAPLLGQRSGLLYWTEVLEGLSYALEPHLLQELDPLP